MNEIFSNELSRLRLSTVVQGAPVTPTELPTAKLYISNSVKFTAPPVELTVSQDVENDNPEGKFLIPVPLNVVKDSRYAKVVYSYNLPGFGDVEKEEFFEIRTRLVPYEEYIVMVDDLEMTFDAFNLAETEARMVIEGYTRQKFSKWTGAATVTSDPNRIYLPQYLSELSGINEYGAHDFALETQDYELEPGGMVVGKTVPIRNFSSSKKFVISGKWGYVSVPDNIKKAAYELTRDFSSSIINKRRQFLLNSAGQGLGASFSEASDMISWRAYQDSTGNSVADLLLANYRVFRPGVI